MIGEVFLSFIFLIGILFIRKYKKFVKNRDQHALEQEVELDFEEELLDNKFSGQEQVLEWLEDEQVTDTIIHMKSKK